MTQLVELQDALPKFEKAGLKLYVVSYDSPKALADFAKHHKIRFPMLSDKGSKVIDRYKIRNHFVTKDQVPYYGIPFPGTYLVDEEGRVTEKFFHKNLAQRESADSLVDTALGQILLGEDAPTASGGNDAIKISATYHGGGGQLKQGLVRHIVVRFMLQEGVHIYSDPVPQGMVATTIRVSGPDGLHAEPTMAPPSHTLSLPSLGKELQVWSGQVDFKIPVWVDDRIASLTRESHGEVCIQVELHYQSCDAQSCHIPRKESLTLKVPVARHLGHNILGKLSGTVSTSMNARCYLAKQVLGGLLQSPIKGLWYLLRTWRQALRGPAAQN